MQHMLLNAGALDHPSSKGQLERRVIRLHISTGKTLVNKQ